MCDGGILLQNPASEVRNPPAVHLKRSRRVYVPESPSAEGLRHLAHGARTCEKIPGRANAFHAKAQSMEGAKKTKQLFSPSLCALASLREIVYFFTTSSAVGLGGAKQRASHGSGDISIRAIQRGHVAPAGASFHTDSEAPPYRQPSKPFQQGSSP
jgi:hypothetical protein